MLATTADYFFPVSPSEEGLHKMSQIGCSRKFVLNTVREDSKTNINRILKKINYPKYFNEISWMVVVLVYPKKLKSRELSQQVTLVRPRTIKSRT